MTTDVMTWDACLDVAVGPVAIQGPPKDGATAKRSLTEALIAEECYRRRSRLDVELAAFAAAHRGELPEIAGLVAAVEGFWKHRCGQPGYGWEPVMVATLLAGWHGRLSWQGDPDGRLPEVEAALWRCEELIADNEVNGWPLRSGYQWGDAG